MRFIIKSLFLHIFQILMNCIIPEYPIIFNSRPFPCIIMLKTISFISKYILPFLHSNLNWSECISNLQTPRNIRSFKTIYIWICSTYKHTLCTYCFTSLFTFLFIQCICPYITKTFNKYPYNCSFIINIKSIFVYLVFVYNTTYNFWNNVLISFFINYIIKIMICIFIINCII